MKHLLIAATICLWFTACPSGQSSQQNQQNTEPHTTQQTSVWDSRNFIEGTWVYSPEPGEEINLSDNKKTREHIDMTLSVTKAGQSRDFFLVGSAKSITQATATVFTSEREELALSYYMEYDDLGTGLSMKASDFKQARTHGLPMEVSLQYASGER